MIIKLFRMKKQRFYKRLISNAFLSLILTSCYNNEIYVDLKDQCIVRKNGYLVELTIYNRDYYSHFSVYAKHNCRSDRFYLINMREKNIDYHITQYGDSIYGDSILPNTEYEVISNSNGDAASCYLHFKTDSLGRIYWTDKDKNSISGVFPWD